MQTNTINKRHKNNFELIKFFIKNAEKIKIDFFNVMILQNYNKAQFTLPTQQENIRNEFPKTNSKVWSKNSRDS